MNYPINVHEHSLFKAFYDELQTYKACTNPAADGSIVDLETYLSRRFFRDLKPFWEYGLDGCVDEEDRRYPSDEWLASLIETPHMPDKFKECLEHGDILLQQLEEAWLWSDWNDTFSFDEETKILTAYTSGWSGCEDIIFALRRAFPWAIKPTEHPCVFKFNMTLFFKPDKEETDEE